MKTIDNKEDIKKFVDSFYSRVQEDDLIGPVFSSRIPDGNWQPHLDKMYSFWNSVLFGASDYKGNPFARHIPLQIQKPHFDRWLKLLAEVINEQFEGAKAAEAIMRAHKMGLIFQSKLEYIKNNPQIRPIM